MSENPVTVSTYAGQEALELVTLDDALAKEMEGWWDDPETKRWMGGYRPQEALQLAANPPKEFRGRVVLSRKALAALKAKRPVALVDFESYDDGTAGVGIVVAPDARGQGLGRSTLKLLVQSEHLKDVQVIFGGIEPENVASIKCLKGAGFVADSLEPDEEGIIYFRRQISDGSRDSGMEDVVSSFLAPLQPFWTGTNRWPNGFDLDIANYLHEKMPPAEFVTSVRTVLITEQGIALLHNADGSHMLPGGRRETGESFLDTLRREVREETGCAIRDPILIGFIHIRTLSPRPADYAYPYPHFFQAVFASEGDRVVEDSSDPDGWEERVEFLSLDELEFPPIASREKRFVEEALRVLKLSGR